MIDFEEHSPVFNIGWMLQDMRKDVIDNIKFKSKNSWYVDIEIVEKNIDKIMDYILSLPTEDFK